MRLFLAFTAGGMSAPAQVLRASFNRLGAGAWAASVDLPETMNLDSAIREAVQAAESAIVLLGPGDESNQYLLYEVRHLLMRTWESKSNFRIGVVAPAVGAIPGALRNQRAVSYFPADVIGVERWEREPELADDFARQWLASDQAFGEPTVGLTAEETRRWRNALVHIIEDPQLDPPDRQTLVAKLRLDLNRGHLGLDEFSGAQDRGLIAASLGEFDLARKFFELARLRNPERVVGADYWYSRGLVSLEAGYFSESALYFEKARSENTRLNGPNHARTIASTYNLGVALQSAGRIDEAIQCYQDMLAAAREVLGRNHPQTAAGAYNLGVLLSRRGSTEDARVLFTEALEAYLLTRPDDSPEVLAARHALELLPSDS